MECLRGFLRIKSRHLVNKQSVRSGFDAQQRYGGTGIVERIAVGSTIFCEGQFGDGNHENWSMLGPGLVELDECTEHLFVVRAVAFARDKKRPGLLVAAGGRPTRGFEEAAQRFVGDVLVRKSSGAPASANQIVNRMVSGCDFLHDFPRDVSNYWSAKEASARLPPLQNATDEMRWLTLPVEG